MNTTTNFEEWLTGADIENHHEAFHLFSAIDDLQECGGFRAVKRETANGNQYFVKCSYSNDQLLLASDKAKESFLFYLEKKFNADELGMDMWYSYKCNMEKDD